MTDVETRMQFAQGYAAAMAHAAQDNDGNVYCVREVVKDGHNAGSELHRENEIPPSGRNEDRAPNQ